MGFFPFYRHIFVNFSGQSDILFVPPTSTYSIQFIAEQFYKTSNCTCAVPCERVVYERKLSYAQLSHLNVQSFIWGSNDYLNWNQSTAGLLEQLRVLYLLPKKKTFDFDSCNHLIQDDFVSLQSFILYFSAQVLFSIRDRSASCERDSGKRRQGDGRPAAGGTECKRGL